MQIVVLDGHAVNPGDLSWDCLREFGTLSVYDRTPPELRHSGSSARTSPSCVRPSSTRRRLRARETSG